LFVTFIVIPLHKSVNRLSSSALRHARYQRILRWLISVAALIRQQKLKHSDAMYQLDKS